MNYKIVCDSISGLVAADKLIQNFCKVDLYIPNNSNFNGFLTKNINAGSRLFELEYQDGSQKDTEDIKRYIPKYKGHSQFMFSIRSYLNELFNDNLVEVNNPELIIDNKVYKDFLYGDYFDEATRFLKNKKEELDDNLNFKINDYNDYLTKLNEFNNYLDISENIHQGELHNIIRNLHNKLNKDFELIPKYHRILWLPILWDSTISNHFNNQTTNLKESIFYKAKNPKYNFVQNLISKLKNHDGVNINYFDPKKFKVLNSKINIENEIIKDSNNLIISLGLRYFEDKTKNIIPDDFQIWNLSNFKIDKSYLLKEFSQLTFTDNTLPYRVSYLDENEDINLCIEYGVNLTDEYKVFEYFVNSKIMTEKVLQNINKTAELKIPFKIPTFKNEKNYNLKLENINDLLKNSIKLSPISFYQSSALNEQIAQGLAIESELE